MTLLFWFAVYAIILSAALARAGHRSGAMAAESKQCERPARILVVGATGGTGRQLVEQGLARGYAVTALARNPAALQIDHPQLTVIQGDVLDYGSVETAMLGQQAVVCALGHKRFFYPTRILSAGTSNILRAMEAQQVPRLICETSLGIGDSAGRMGLYYTLFTIPVILPFYFWDKTRQERVIAASSVDWVIIRPGALKNAAKRDGLRHGRGVGNFLSTVSISRADVADFMLEQLESNTYLGTAPGVSW